MLNHAAWSDDGEGEVTERQHGVWCAAGDAGFNAARAVGRDKARANGTDRAPVRSSPVPAPAFRSAREQDTALIRALIDIDDHLVRPDAASVASEDADVEHRRGRWVEGRTRRVADRGEARARGAVPVLGPYRTVAENDEPTGVRKEVLSVTVDRSAMWVVTTLPPSTVEREHNVVAAFGEKVRGIDHTGDPVGLGRVRAGDGGQVVEV